MLGEGLIGWNMLLCFSELRCSSRLLSTRWYAHFATTYIDPNWTDGDTLKFWLTLLWKIWQNSCMFFCNRNVMWVLESEEILLINQSFVAGPGNLALSFSYKAFLHHHSKSYSFQNCHSILKMLSWMHFEIANIQLKMAFSKLAQSLRIIKLFTECLNL